MTKHIGGRWYIRQKGKIKGPFAAGQLSNDILLGRLEFKDEVSNDKETWRRISQVKDLIPDVMKGDMDDPFMQDRLLAAQRWADEREPPDRRTGEDPDTPYKAQRRKGDRRENIELDEVLGHRNIASKRNSDDEDENTFVGWILLLLILGGIGWGGYYAYMNPSEEVTVDCQSKVMPNVNWQNCLLQGRLLNGADLSGSNLRSTNLRSVKMQSAILVNTNADYANMDMGKLADSNLTNVSMLGASLRNADLRNVNFTNANLSFADLSGADLSGADLTGANLSKTIWVDGTVCATGSVSVCSQL